MCDEINECSRCGLRGYEFVDVVNKICHLCVKIEYDNVPIINQLEGIYTKFINDDFGPHWMGLNFGKMYIGNSIVGAIREYDKNWLPQRAQQNMQRTVGTLPASVVLSQPEILSAKAVDPSPYQLQLM